MAKKIYKNNTKNIKQVDFFTYDLETFTKKKGNGYIHETYLITLVSKIEIKVWFKENENHNILREFINYIKEKYPNYKGFAHNAGNFDARHILNELGADEFMNKNKTCLIKDGSILALYLKNNISLVDSFHLLPRKLRSLAKEFKLDISKGDIPHDKITANTYKSYKDEAIKYCIKDSQILYDVLKHFQQIILTRNISPIDPLECLTLPQFAFQTFRTERYFPDDWDLYKLDRHKYNFISEGY